MPRSIPGVWEGVLSYRMEGHEVRRLGMFSTRRTPIQTVEIMRYGAVAYRRQVNRDGDVHISFIASKSHVIPLNPKRASHHNSVPRVEIVSAEKAVQLKRFVGKTIKLDNLVVRFWSDSESALKMIYNPAKPRPVFFANRLSKIHSGSDPQQWRWVDSSNNPADHCSRGIQAHEAEKWRQFHHGPAFLRLPEDQWPKTNIATCPISAQVAALYVAESEKKQVADAILLAAASRGKWMHKLRIIGMVLIAVKRWRAYPRAKTRAAKDLLPKPEVTQDVLEEARKQLVKSMQRHHYSDVFEQLELGKVFKPESRHDFIIKNKEMRKLNPFVNDDGILRVGSRLANADISNKAKYPELMTEAFRSSDITPVYIRAVQGHCAQTARQVNAAATLFRRFRTIGVGKSL